MSSAAKSPSAREGVFAGVEIWSRAKSPLARIGADDVGRICLGVKAGSS